MNVSFSDFIGYYKSWFLAIDQRHNPLDFEVIYRLLYLLGYHSSVNHITFIQGVSLFGICISVILNLQKFEDFGFRTQVLGIVMSWVILFSTTAEKHTYVIAMTGLVIWFLSGQKTRVDKVLLWINFFLISIVPIDAIIPKSIMYFLHDKLALNLLFFTITWLRMFTFTFFSRKSILKNSQVPKNCT
jgi:hypothetical protein